MHTHAWRLAAGGPLDVISVESSARLANTSLGRQSHCLGPVGLPWAARAKEGPRILITLSRFGIDPRTRCNLKTKEGVGSCAAQV